MKKSEILVAPDYYNRYISLADERGLIEQLSDGATGWFRQNLTKLNALGDKTYAENKWTVRQIVHHVCDTERIFSTRALKVARGETEPQKGFEEDIYASNAGSNKRSMESILDEYDAVRNSSLHFFKSLSKDQLMKSGIVSGHGNSVLAMGFILIGHPKHHANVIAERYFPLL